MEEKEQGLISDESKLILGSVLMIGLIVLGHDAMVHGYNLQFIGPFLNCSLSPRPIASGVV